MSRITIADLPQDATVSQEEMRKLRGGIYIASALIVEGSKMGMPSMAEQFGSGAHVPKPYVASAMLSQRMGHR